MLPLITNSFVRSHFNLACMGGMQSILPSIPYRTASSFDCPHPLQFGMA